MITKEELVNAVPYIYHLTDRRNLDFIIGNGKLYSTVQLAQQSDEVDKDEMLKTRRPKHRSITIKDSEIWIRDQRPLNAALDKCLTPGWTRQQYIYLLNSRVFFWPNEGRLRKHFSRYEAEEPVILKININDALELNAEVELCHLNSGATRPLGVLGGVAPQRGANTFMPIETYDKGLNKLAEVTFPNGFILPKNFKISYNPDDNWEDVSIE